MKKKTRAGGVVADRREVLMRMNDDNEVRNKGHDKEENENQSRTHSRRSK